MGSRWKMLLSSSIVGVAVVASACGGSSSSGEATGPAEGVELFQANCATCHGSDLDGTSRGPSLLSIVYEPGHHPDAAIRSAIRNGAPQHHWGFGAMPPVRGLDDGEVEAIISFLRAEQERQGFQR